MGISRDSRHKRSATGAKRAFYRKKRYGVFPSYYLKFCSCLCVGYQGSCVCVCVCVYTRGWTAVEDDSGKYFNAPTDMKTIFRLNYKLIVFRSTELSRRAASPPTPVWAQSASTLSAPVVVTRSSVLSVSSPVTSPGVPRALPARPVSSVSLSTPPTTSWSAQTP